MTINSCIRILVFALDLDVYLNISGHIFIAIVKDYGKHIGIQLIYSLIVSFQFVYLSSKLPGMDFLMKLSICHVRRGISNRSEFLLISLLFFSIIHVAAKLANAKLKAY